MSERMTDTARWYRERLGLAEEVVKIKDATIKALADALLSSRMYGDEADDMCWCAAPCSVRRSRDERCVEKVALLRHVGSIP
jgi:hypothetical protein